MTSGYVANEDQFMKILVEVTPLLKNLMQKVRKTSPKTKSLTYLFAEVDELIASLTDIQSWFREEIEGIGKDINSLRATFRDNSEKIDERTQELKELIEKIKSTILERIAIIKISMEESSVPKDYKKEVQRLISLI